MVRSNPGCPSNDTSYCGNTFDIQIDGTSWVAASGFAQADQSSVEVVVKASGAKQVTGIRHLYGAWPLCVIYNKDGFPATPFIVQNLH